MPDNPPRQTGTDRPPSAEYNSRFDHLDAAASAIIDTLRAAKIPHPFIGGYAATLLGGTRITQSGLVERACFDLLLSNPSFTRSTDNRLMFRFKGRPVCIDLHLGSSSGKSCWDLPNPDQSYPWPVNVGLIKARPVLSKNYSEVKILHPSQLLLTKLLAWARSALSNRLEETGRTTSHIEEIEAILKFLLSMDRIVEFGKIHPARRQWFRWLLGFAYRRTFSIRSLLAQTTSPEDLADSIALAKDTSFGQFLYG